MPSRETQGVQKRDINAAQRVALAVKLRTQKVKYDDIAKACGYSNAGAAYKAVQREMQRVVVVNVEELRREALNNLDMMHAECWKIILEKEAKGSNKLFAMDRLVAIEDRRAKLMNLDKRPEEEATAQNYTKRIILTHQTSVEVQHDTSNG